MRLNFLKTLLACLCILLLASACKKTDEDARRDMALDKAKEIEVDPNTLKICGIAPLTGDASVYGISAKNGAELAVEEINALGEMPRLELEFNDDTAQSEKAVQIYEKAASSGTQVILGPITNSCADAVYKASKDDILMHLLPSVTEPGCVDGINSFRMCCTDEAQGRLIADNVKNDGINYTAVLYNSSDPYSKTLYESFRAEYEKIGGKIVVVEYFAKGDTGYKSQIDRLKSYNFDAVFLPVYYTQAEDIANAFKANGLNKRLYGCDGWFGLIEHSKTGTANLNGAKFYMPYFAWDNFERNRVFVDAYKEKYGTEPNIYAAYTYDCVYVVKAALEKSGKNVPSPVLCKNMLTIRIDGVLGATAFKKDGEPDRNARMATVDNGKYIILSK